MPARPFLLVLLMLPALLAPAAPEAAAPPELTAAIQRQVAERETLQRQAADSNAALTKWYNAALDAVKKSAVSQGDLEGVLTLDEERDRTERELTPEEKAKLPPALRPVRAQFDQARLQRAVQQRAAQAASLKAYLVSLETLEKLLTQKLELEGAIAVRKERAAAAELLAAIDAAPGRVPPRPTAPPPAATPPTVTAARPVPATPIPTPAPFGVTGRHVVITGRFDTDDLVIERNAMHIEHLSGTKPEGVTVNGRKWDLKWTDNRSNDFPFKPPLVFGASEAVLNKIKTRAQVGIIEHPNTGPDAKLVIHIRDDAAGLATVELTAQW